MHLFNIEARGLILHFANKIIKKINTINFTEAEALMVFPAESQHHDPRVWNIISFTVIDNFMNRLSTSIRRW
jgi:hypothetical protein